MSINNKQIGLLSVEGSGKILFANSKSAALLKKDVPTLMKKSIQSILPNSTILEVIKTENIAISICELVNHLYLIEIPNGEGKGIILIFDKLSDFNYLKEQETLNSELETLMNLSGDIVTITDYKGTVLRVSEKSEGMLGINPKEYIGKSVIAMHNKGFFNPPTTEKVINTGEEVTVTQETITGKRFILRSYPIFDNYGNVKKIIHIGKDVTEENTLREKLKESKNLANHLQFELNNIKKIEDKIIVKSKIMEDVYDLVTKVATYEATILILGESGVGKEIVAQKIHQLSHRYKHPFVKVNCGSIPESLIESELFGYVKGAFTGASNEGKEGLIKAANKGTLFLDEIGELPLNLQVKLLQVLQDKQVTSLGETTPNDVDIRFIAATNRNIKDMVKEGKFRKDLYYRLNVVPVMIPPLRKRKEDIPFFINYFLNLYNEKYKESKILDEKVIQLFSEKLWDGNVRELENTIERLIVTIPSNNIQIHHVPHDIYKQEVDYKVDESLEKQMNNYEKGILERELKKFGTLKEVSERLSVDISTISRKVKKHNLDI